MKKRGSDLVVGELGVAEICEAEKLWIRWEQSIITKEDEKFKKMTSSLNLFFDDQQLIRLNTRLNRSSQLHYENKNLLLLRRDSHFTKLIVLRSHEQVFHSGVESTLSDIRLYYWILRGRSFVKYIVKNCFICKLVLGKSVLPPPTPLLPDYRLHCMYPFETSGIDYAGPVYVKNIYADDGTLFKCYFLLISCATTRAVHIEVTSNFTTKTLVLALRRCFARRGLPSKFVSDNFKTFKASDLKNFLRVNRIQWEFILEKSPWWGGFYERLIGVIKNCLKKVVFKAKLDYEELNTVIIETEKCVNSRPLTYLSDEHEDSVITPNHLIYGRDINRNNVIKYEFKELTNDDMRKRKLYCVQVLKHFTQRFVKQYLLALQERPLKNQNISTTCSLKVGDLVLIKEDITPRLLWRRGVVDDLVTGHDGESEEQLFAREIQRLKGSHI